MRAKCILVLMICLMQAGCHRAQSWSAPGNTEWDRAAVLAEISEPVIAVAVAEGQRVEEGQLLLQLDPRRTDAQLQSAQANAQRLDAQLLELRHGAREEVIANMRAQLVRAESDAENAQRERERNAALRKTSMVSQQAFDTANNAARVAQANASAVRAQLQELLHGTRPEELAQAEAALAGAQADVRRLQLIRERLDVRAPRAGRIDALPYKLGDQPPQGATLVSLLTGTAPYARVFIPEKQRASLQPGAHFRVQVDGIEHAFDATLRNLQSDPSFTPYYALNGDDASRLSYRAELVLQGDAAREIPPGIPCQAQPVNDNQARPLNDK